jgi:hypothetical protein
VIARLYAAARLHVNFFQPSFKLKEKRREGANSERLCRHPLMRICRPSNDNVPEAVPQGTLTGATLMILPSTDISLTASSK